MLLYDLLVELLSETPVMIAGPNTIVGLSRGTFDRSAMVARLVPAYVAALQALKELGVPEVQVQC